mmetsp:Transcript_5139/g.9350  ORF Transcript_5139/g.9350 Transcript_5139/m.9350 type:complete len:145 (+) Transcript_5139:222-656(+)|eukprot:CAMPEP_0184696404 /NCGR_PEP_ID=MMETSP0313-20130426/3716_1 /TAXON_ID=2792 /ORGANISM="Porphyridium aerugineum, Strain SAG 1380-2" /LENGTH=144 /DNA_ID=CAMNT_0027155031 /DNA_START=220 /DNA_END=654 /DNA_ORIENTATION=-
MGRFQKLADDFELTKFEFGRFPNQYYIVPETVEVQGGAKPHKASPVFQGVSASKLYSDYVPKMVQSKERVKEVGRNDDRRQLVYVCRSKVCRFPDIVILRVVEVGADSSSLLVYSRSKYGFGDSGVNEARVTDWVDTLQKLTAE